MLILNPFSEALSSYDDPVLDMVAKRVYLGLGATTALHYLDVRAKYEQGQQNTFGARRSFGEGQALAWTQYRDGTAAAAREHAVGPIARANMWWTAHPTRALSAGLQPALLQGLCTPPLWYFLYEQCRDTFSPFTSVLVATAATTQLFAPFECIKTRRLANVYMPPTGAIDRNQFSAKGSSKSIFASMSRYGGPGVIVGSMPTHYTNMLFAATFYPVYDITSRVTASVFGRTALQQALAAQELRGSAFERDDFESAPAATLGSSIAAGVSAVVASLVSHPMDSIKTYIQSREKSWSYGQYRMRSIQYVVPVYRKIRAAVGLKGFYVGWHFRAARLGLLGFFLGPLYEYAELVTHDRYVSRALNTVPTYISGKVYLDPSVTTKGYENLSSRAAVSDAYRSEHYEAYSRYDMHARKAREREVEEIRAQEEEMDARRRASGVR